MCASYGLEVVNDYSGLDERLVTRDLLDWFSARAPAKLTAFNARSEKLTESPLWRGPFRNRRILIPASNYLERASQPGVKGHYRFHHPELPLFAIAGIAASTGPEAGPATSFAMVTRPPAAPGAGIHDRMPLIVPAGFQQAWLDPDSPADQTLVDAAVAASQELSEQLTVDAA